MSWSENWLSVPAHDASARHADKMYSLCIEMVALCVRTGEIWRPILQPYILLQFKYGKTTKAEAGR